MEEKKQGRILIVDDEPSICSVVSNYLGFHEYETVSAGDAESALECLWKADFDCVLSDMNMPGRSGLDLLHEVRRTWPEIGFILITAQAAVHTAVEAMRAGASDFLIKPVQLNQLLHCLDQALEKKRLKSELQTYQQRLENLVEERTSQIQEAMHALERSHFDTLQCLCHAAEYRDDETGNHVLRIGKYCEILARASGLPPEEISLLHKASPLHDIGKIGIPDHILLKPGKLTAEEFEIMKRHTRIGSSILKDANSKVLQMAETVARTHHEKWDGSGYPDHLRGEEIPIIGRIAAVADVFDALTMKRCYKPAFTLETSANIINQSSGKHFDPDLVDAFNTRFREFVAVFQEYAEV